MNEYWLRRIDAHLERGAELMERNERAFDRFVEADDRNTRAFDRNTEAFHEWKASQAEFRAALADFRVQRQEDLRAQREESREFIREITLRVERGGRAHVRALNALSDRVGKEAAELVQEMRAQRGALLAILDRLKPGDSGATP